MKGELLKFKGIEGYDIYNPSSTFIDNDSIYIAARVEERNDELNSKVMFFKEYHDKWILDNKAPILDLQDPFVTRINDELILGGVKVFPHNKGIGFKTVFYKGKNIKNLKEFAEGPIGMKDIRLIKLPTNEIGIFTRLRGEIGGKGKIGFMTINSIESLSDCDFYKAELIENQFNEEEWGGVNEVHYLQDNSLGVLGHIANREFRTGIGIKHYCAMAFTFNYVTREAAPLKIIATRKEFPETPSKRSPELDDVLFTSGLRELSNGLAELIVGISDTRAGKIIIKNPFK